MIELGHITKRFGAVQALSDVSLQITPGRILGLLGENGAGKSTLMHILFGMARADGEIRVNGAAARIRSPRDAQRLGMGMVHQHFKLVPTLTGLENLRMSIRASAGQMRALAEELLARLRWTVPLDVRVEELTVGQQQRIEIVKALMSGEGAGQGVTTMGDGRLKAGLRTLILDEPTAVLTPQETGELFAALRSLRDGGAAVVFISHKLNEVRQICDDVAILRRGKLVHAGAAAELSAEAMAEKMVGVRVEIPTLSRSAPADDPRPPSATARAEQLSLQHISTELLKDASLSLRAGEILGIAGVDGNGQSHLAQVILGARLAASGEVQLAGAPAGRAIRERLEKIAFIAEDRQKEALVLPLSVQDNLMLKDYRQGGFNTLGWLRFAAWRTQSRKLMEQFDIRAGSPASAVGRLSGGNQQKVVLARELHGTDKPVVLAVNPTRGLDVGATAFVMQKLLEARARGAAVLLIHSDLDELLAVSDRVAVMFNGRLTQTNWPQTTREAIGRLMLGVAEAAA